MCRRCFVALNIKFFCSFQLAGTTDEAELDAAITTEKAKVAEARERVAGAPDSSQRQELLTYVVIILFVSYIYINERQKEKTF